MIFDRDRRVLELKVAGLVFLVIGVREEHRRETIEGQHAIGLGIVGLRHHLGAIERGVVGMMLHRERHTDAQRLGPHRHARQDRSEEHTSELQSLMRISYAVFCLKKKKEHKFTETYNRQLTKL